MKDTVIVGLAAGKPQRLASGIRQAVSTCPPTSLGGERHQRVVKRHQFWPDKTWISACVFHRECFMIFAHTLECLPKNGTTGTYGYDFADVLSAEDEAEFNQTIQSLNDTTPNSIAW